MTTLNNPTYSNNKVLTAPYLNEYIRDNYSATFPYTAKGDMAIGIGSNSIHVLPVGSNYKLLSALSSETTGVKWSGVPITTYSSSDAAISTNSVTYVTMITRTVTIGQTSTIVLKVDGFINQEMFVDSVYYKPSIGNTDGQIKRVSLNTRTAFMCMQVKANVPVGDIVIRAQWKIYTGPFTAHGTAVMTIMVIPE